MNRIEDLLEADQDPRLGFVLSLGAPIASIDDDVVRVDAFSSPVDSRSRLGGDWVDAFRTIDGRLVISVGDVMGSGLGAAGAMLAARQALRAVALIDADPGMILLAVDRVMRMQHPDLFCSAFVAVVDPVTQRASYANAGHPLPYLWFPDRSIRQLRGRALPLGIDLQPAYPVEQTDVPPGSRSCSIPTALSSGNTTPSRAKRRWRRPCAVLRSTRTNRPLKRSASR